MDAIVRALVASPGGKAIQAAFTHGINTMKLVRRVGPDGLRQSGIAVATSLKASLVETRSSLSSSLTAGPTTAIDEIKRTAKLIAAPGLGRQLHQTLLDPFANMAVGMGVAASMATREQHKLSLSSFYHVFSHLESALDESTSEPVKAIWSAYEPSLRRSHLLEQDLKEMGAWPPAAPSPETQCYLHVITDAAQSDEVAGTARLLGHIYSRHISDALAAPVLGALKKRALEVSPKQHLFDASTLAPWSLASMTTALNEAGELAGSDDARAAIVAEATRGLKQTGYMMSEIGGTKYRFAPGGLVRVLLGYKDPDAPPLLRRVATLPMNVARSMAPPSLAAPTEPAEASAEPKEEEPSYGPPASLGFKPGDGMLPRAVVGIESARVVSWRSS